MRRRTILGALVLASAPALAAPPDCTGISNVINSSPDLINELTTIRVASGLSSPVFMTYAPGDNDRLFIVEQVGRIRIVKNGVLLATPFLDIDAKTTGSGERGLLSVAFHPDYQNPTNRYFFVYYTANDGAITIERYQRNAGNADLADLGSATLVKSIPHTAAANHNGGTVAFSPIDGHLYFATGDGGGGCDPGAGIGNAQTLTSDLGKLHRLGVDSLPADTTGNPFDGVASGNDSIWAYGLRNPYRFTIDRITGAIYIGDVGQDVWEEVDCSPASSSGGENYGWVNMEGDHCPNASCGSQSPCPPNNYVAPIREYNQAGGSLCSVIGGPVYRGCRMSALQGTYFYTDYCSGNAHDFIKSLRTDATCSASATTLEREPDLTPGGLLTIDEVVGMGEDNRGEIYLVDYDGEIYKVIPNLSIVELSGPNATPFRLGANFTWENLQAISGIPVRFYRTYRSSSPTGTFSCIHRQVSTSNSWVGGDPAVPAVGQGFYYLVAAENVTGEIGHGGVGTNGAPHNMDNVTPCL
jgi:glucose/arabinose dehydrogenase